TDGVNRGTPVTTHTAAPDGVTLREPGGIMCRADCATTGENYGPSASARTSRQNSRAESGRTKPRAGQGTAGPARYLSPEAARQRSDAHVRAHPCFGRAFF